MVKELKVFRDKEFNKMRLVMGMTDEMYKSILVSRVKYGFYRVLYGKGINYNSNEGIDIKPIITKIKDDLFELGFIYSIDDIELVLWEVIHSKIRFRVDFY